jgi:endonuclease IV
VEPFRWLLADPRTEGISLVLETPHERSEVEEEDASADPFDVKMMALLATLLPAAP